jgi:hypothetical protein
MRDISTSFPSLLLSEWPEEDRVAYMKDPFTEKAKRRLLGKLQALYRRGYRPFISLRDDGEFQVCNDITELGKRLSEDDRQAVISLLEQCNYRDEFVYCTRVRSDWLMTQLVHVPLLPPWRRWIERLKHLQW